jgi:hypothetical protein
MSALLTLLKNDPAAVDKLEIRQILALCGNGKLSDGSECSTELREYLQIAKSENLFSYADSCLSESFDKCGQVLQDIVNELGRRLDYAVENGFYQGRVNASGNDGLWSDGENHAIVVEVKTTDAYRINLDTIVSYQNKLRQLSRIPPSVASSVLLVVGRQDTGDLEAQVRGSRHAWVVRIISIDALKQLVSLKENAGFAAVQKIHELLVPFEYTRLDRIIEIAFTVVEDASAALEDDGSGVEIDAEHASPREHQISSSATIETIRSAILDRLRTSYPALIKKSRALFWSADKDVRAAITVSKRYPGGDYWYAYHVDWDQFLGQGSKGLFILGCIGRPEAFAIPYEWIHSRLGKLHVTERDGGKHYHISLYPQPNGELTLHLRNGVDEPLDAFRIPFEPVISTPALALSERPA